MKSAKSNHIIVQHDIYHETTQTIAWSTDCYYKYIHHKKRFFNNLMGFMKYSDDSLFNS